MVSYLPKPYPDELLYSVIARLGVHLGLNGNNLTEMFGHSRQAVVDLPSSMDHFAKVTSALWGLSADEIIDKYTLFPIYSHFITEDRSISIRENLKYCSKRTNSGVSNLTYSSGLDRPKYLRFCPLCLASDIETYGESYWRRAHQIPGVLLCNHHSSPLVDSDARYRPYPKSTFADATNNLKIKHREPALNITQCSELLIDIAKYSYELLQNDSNCLKFDISGEAYRHGAFHSGFYKQSDKLNINELEDAFLNYFGENTLNAMGVSIDLDCDSNWLRKIFRKHNYVFQPIQHILVHLFLENTGKNSNFVNQFGTGPWKCPNRYANHKENAPIHRVKFYSSTKGIRVASAKCSCGFNFTFHKVADEDQSLPIVNSVRGFGPTWAREANRLATSGLNTKKIAEQLNISHKTASDLVANRQYSPKHLSASQIHNNRIEWLKLFEIAQSKLGVKKLNEPLYKQVRLHDKSWLDSCPSKTDRKIGVKVIDWDIRDKMLSNEIYHVAAILYNNSTPIWVTKSLIAARMSISGILKESYLSRLPACREALLVSVETLDDFHERKIQHVKQMIQKDDLPLTRRWVLKLANINGPPFSPRTEAAITNALTVYP